jgi:hypothetical protein
MKDVAIVMGDLNAEVGSENLHLEHSMGRHGLGEKNENGSYLSTFAHKIAW